MKILLPCLLSLLVGCSTDMREASSRPSIQNGQPTWDRIGAVNCSFIDIIEFMRDEANAILPPDEHIDFRFTGFDHQTQSQRQIDLNDLVAINDIIGSGDSSPFENTGDPFATGPIQLTQAVSQLLAAKQLPTDPYWISISIQDTSFCNVDLKKVTIEDVLNRLRKRVGFHWTRVDGTYLIDM